MMNRTFVLSPLPRAVMITVGLFGLTACQTPNLSLSRATPAPVVDAPLRQQVMPVPVNGKVTVQEGENIYVIAARFQVSPYNIIRDNQIGPPYIVQPGQQLVINAPRVHIVRPEDSIFSISQRYAVSQFQLAQANGLNDPFEIYVGQRLILPAKLDFSVLEGGLPNDVSSANAAPANAGASASTNAQSSNTPSQPRKKFVAPSLGGGAGTFTWPLEGQVVAEFGPAARGVHNDGVNIAAVQGTEVKAAATGTVAFVGRDIKSFGTLVLVKHDGGIISAYAHLDAVTVQEGDIVKLGDPIGTVGQTGKVDSPQLHFEIRKSRKPIDPRSLIA
ncbi:peptidoglycan DD-metalloendopeptidase family protein [Alphaproteobacteria bacterium]|nr:peptidoglycan DD-metalloendopeptidase family protein [Alphaproteobacteria bacterium]